MLPAQCNLSWCVNLLQGLVLPCGWPSWCVCCSVPPTLLLWWASLFALFFCWGGVAHFFLFSFFSGGAALSFLSGVAPLFLFSFFSLLLQVSCGSMSDDKTLRVVAKRQHVCCAMLCRAVWHVLCCVQSAVL